MPTPTRATLPTVYWDGTITFRDAAMKTGVSWEGVTGQFSSRGLYLGDRLGRVVGNLAVDKGESSSSRSRPCPPGSRSIRPSRT